MKLSEKLAETLIKRYPNPNDYPYKSWSYSQGFMLWGMEALWRKTGEKKYYDYIMSYAETHVDSDGKLLKFDGSSMDDMMSGAVIVWAYTQTNAQKFRIACDTIRKSYNDYPRNPDGGFWHNRKLKGQMWVDGVFMGQMFLTKYGYYIADKEYCFDEAALQLKVIYDRCNKDGLIIHAYSEDRQASWADKTTGLSPEVWSEGLGWYALILPQVLELMPADHRDRERLVRQYKEMLDSLKKHQSPANGLWFQVVDKDKEPDNWNDTSGSAMFAYSIQKAVELGIVKKDEFGPVVKKAWQGLVTKAKINDEGLLDIYDACDGVCVKKDYETYINYPRSVNAKEAVAAFLWAGGVCE
ncbi:MAG: glycoside hydrolase family 88 protein [Treponema sp.]|nr:glycoside hydrolase family 88 protein [Treponema sp.]